MQPLLNSWRRPFAVWLLLLTVLATPAHAHLMVAQKGTLNLHGDGAYLVLSLPVSALTGIDDDGDQRISAAELRAHGARIEQQVLAGVRLSGDGRALPLEGLMLVPSPPDDAPQQPADQLVVMGRFSLGTPPAARHVLAIHLFGRADAERAYAITVTHHPEAQVAHFTPAQQEQALFPAAAAVFAEQARSGLAHVLLGADHLLFLLVVFSEAVSARRGWRKVLLLLSSFTLGHAITLVGSVMGGWTVPAALVEPAIAATVVGMAAAQLWQSRRGRWSPPGWQLAWVFACSLVHGLGLAGGLQVQGLGGANLAVALAGFNLGIELAQTLVVGLAALLGLALHRLGRFNRTKAGQATSVLAAAAGVCWFIQRVGGL